MLCLRNQGWINERLVHMPSIEVERIVLVSDNDPPAHRNKVQEVVKMMESELGCGWIYHKLCKVYLFISSQRIAGCLVAERIKEAFRVICDAETKRTEAKGPIIKEERGRLKSAGLQFGNIMFQREVVRKILRVVNKNEDVNGAIYCEEEAVPALCGIRAIWVSPSNRRKRIGTHLLDAVSSESETRCSTFAVLRTNSRFSSLSNLSFYLGINKFVVADTNGFSADTEFLPRDLPLLIPIDCKCNSAAGVFEAELTKTAIKGESLFGILDSLEGLTSCQAIWDKNPRVLPWNLGDGISLTVPIKCACPTFDKSPGTRLLITYPLAKGDSVSTLASRFNTTQEAIILTNNRTSGGFFFDPERLSSSIPPVNRRGKRRKMWSAWIYIALTGVAVGICIAVAAVFTIIHLKRRRDNNHSSGKKPGGLVDDVELQQLSLSIRTTSDKKVSFEGSVIGTTTPRNKVLLETFTLEELRKATEGFSASNHIGGSVHHGRLGGKSLAIKITRPETVAKVEFGLFKDGSHKHPNIVRLLGTCLSEASADSDSYFVFEYAKNGSLKDWIHGGLAIKSQFIASCDCFLTWAQRLRICLDVAMALQYMHHIMSPSYIHRNVKSRNIFLDEEFNAKIGNFGMPVSPEEGDPGPGPNCSQAYLAPEFVRQGKICPSLDVFAYGVVLLEVLTGRPPVIGASEGRGEKGIHLSEKIKSVLNSEDAEGEIREWIDGAIGDSYPIEGALQLANLARACTEEDPTLRPSAGEVVEVLLRLVDELPAAQGESCLMSESSSKPLVKAAASNSAINQ
ncbi:hypothetical protein CRG98_019299 [Punica granatum]|uniref:Protein LYK2 n=1 Tax=Punica granatum TaxID=22663 RepID=A0A2I0JWX2_PUNGR|nr:hypothetical protein CRG98_019299 [Punica granatum]